MRLPQPVLQRAACYLSFGAAISVLFSIAISQILLGLALAALLISGTKLRLPPIWLPLGLFVVGTIISLAISSDLRAGLVQIRKFYVWTILLAVFSSIRDLALIRKLFLCWAAVGSASAVWGIVQFARKVSQARVLGVKFYDYYTGERITGAMSHWMTFGGQEMFALLMLAAYLFFGPERRLRRLWPWLACGALLAVALLLGQTRIIWLATLVAGAYLMWYWDRRAVFVLPLVLAAVVLLGPSSIGERVSSMFRPRKDIDSNQFRIVTWRTGLRMIEAHPWFGLGPEGPRLHFDEYVPADVPRPLPVGSYIHLHNIYLHYAAERGIPAMLAMVWLLVKLLVDFTRALRKLPPGPGDRRYVLRGAVAVVLAAMVTGCAELNLGDSEILTMFLVAIACGYVAVESAGEKESAVA